MGILQDIKHKRLPAKSIDDLLIPDEAWKPDIEIVDRYQSYATELMRVSLIGFAGFGFLISAIVMPNYNRYCNLVIALKYPAIVCLICFVVSLGLALSHRFYSTWCIFYQVLIGRSLIRIKNANNNWSDKDLRAEAEYLARAREAQRQKSTRSNWILKGSATFLIIGFIALSVIFYNFLNSFANNPAAISNPKCVKIADSAGIIQGPGLVNQK